MSGQATKAWLMGKPETACTPVVSGLPFGSQVTAASDELECVLKRGAFLSNTSSSDRWRECEKKQPKAASSKLDLVNAEISSINQIMVLTLRATP